MTIPEFIIILMVSLGTMLLVIRLWLELVTWRRKARRAGLYTIGASKTIGNREVQEDEYGTAETEEGIMAVLADGMGKHYGGKVASRIAVEVFQDIFEERSAYYNPQYSFRKAFQAANQKILNKLEENQGCASVGALMVRDRKLYYAVVGNVQIAVYRSHELVPVTQGHTINVLAKQKYVEGKLTRQEAVSLMNENRLYNYVGQDGFHDVEFFDIPIALYGGEYILLMSDGLYETARWKDIEDCLEAEASCQEKAFAIIELVNQSQEEHKDNAAIQIIQIR